MELPEKNPRSHGRRHQPRRRATPERTDGLDRGVAHAPATSPRTPRSSGHLSAPAERVTLP